MDLAGANLNLGLLPGYSPNVGDQFDLIHSLVSVSGTFANLPLDGSMIFVGGHYFKVGYGTNDVTLTAVATPVQSAVINDGSAQRSQLQSITVTFSTGVGFMGAVAGSFAPSGVASS